MCVLANDDILELVNTDGSEWAEATENKHVTTTNVIVNRNILLETPQLDPKIKKNKKGGMVYWNRSANLFQCRIKIQFRSPGYLNCTVMIDQKVDAEKFSRLVEQHAN